MHTSTRRILLATLTGLVVLAACGEKPKQPAQAPAAAPTAEATGKATPCPTCKVIVVTMNSTDAGNFFAPNHINAHVGDVLRFTVAVGVHNADFLPDSNPGRSGLPPASPLLQLPGQTWEIALNFGTGKFYFQCDPHAALGMKGTVEVEKE